MTGVSRVGECNKPSTTPGQGAGAGSNGHGEMGTNPAMCMSKKSCTECLQDGACAWSAGRCHKSCSELTVPTDTSCFEGSRHKPEEACYDCSTATSCGNCRSHSKCTWFEGGFCGTCDLSFGCDNVVNDCSSYSDGQTPGSEGTNVGGASDNWSNLSPPIAIPIDPDIVSSGPGGMGTNDPAVMMGCEENPNEPACVVLKCIDPATGGFQCECNTFVNELQQFAASGNTMAEAVGITSEMVGEAAECCSDGMSLDDFQLCLEKAGTNQQQQGGTVPGVECDLESDMDVCGPEMFCEPLGSCDSSIGVCATILPGCTEQYDPVCGCDDITYSNICEAHVAMTGVSRMGKCDSPVTTPAPGQEAGAPDSSGEEPFPPPTAGEVGTDADDVSGKIPAPPAAVEEVGTDADNVSDNLPTTPETAETDGSNSSDIDEDADTSEDEDVDGGEDADTSEDEDVDGGEASQSVSSDENIEELGFDSAAAGLGQYAMLASVVVLVLSSMFI